MRVAKDFAQCTHAAHAQCNNVRTSVVGVGVSGFWPSPLSWPKRQGGSGFRNDVVLIAQKNNVACARAVITLPLQVPQRDCVGVSKTKNWLS